MRAIPATLLRLATAASSGSAASSTPAGSADSAAGGPSPADAAEGFSEPATQTLVGANATRGNATFGPGSSELFAVAGPSQSAGIVSITTRQGPAAATDREGQEAQDPRQTPQEGAARGDQGPYVVYTVDLQPPLGPNTYIGGVTISYTLSGPNTTAVSFGLRRDAPDGCCAGGLHGALQSYCDGLYTARFTQTEGGGERTAVVDRSTIAYVARDNATAGAAFDHSIMSPDGQMKLDIVFSMAASGADSTAASVLRVTKITYEYPPLYIEDACNLVIPWSKNGHGSIGGQWLMFCAPTTSACRS